MFETIEKAGVSREKNLITAIRFVKAQLKNEKNLLANLSNISAIIAAYMDDINWAGFYLMVEGELILGPFQGKPACNRIEIGKGVCGTAVASKQTQVVKNVLELENHIACDSASRSELVVPIYKGDTIFGVLDIDSPSFARFGDLEKTSMEELVKLLEASL
ncbi:MAG: GAF domain-containing protein [Clostridiaceae bacterium]